MPLTKPGTAAIGLMLLLAAHAKGWPVPIGGAQAITDALVKKLLSLGGAIETDRWLRAPEDLPPARVRLFDTSPEMAARLTGAPAPRFAHGHGVFKLDWALDRPIPWRDPAVARAGTVHLGGRAEEIHAAERAPAAGRVAEAPYVLLAQPTLFDPSRAPAGKHTAWAYCHVPAGSRVDQAAAIEAQVERFAPGFAASILARRAHDTAALEAGNPNLVGGDINAGALNLTSLLFRPRVSLAPYRLAGKGNYLCSAATPPGPGVHGMCGYHAARQALRNHGGT